MGFIQAPNEGNLETHRPKYKTPVYLRGGFRNSSMGGGGGQGPRKGRSVEILKLTSRENLGGPPNPPGSTTADNIIAS